MTKSLTENTWVYTDKGVENVHWCNVNGVDELVTPKGEVLAPVPSYEEYQRLVVRANMPKNPLADTMMCYDTEREREVVEPLQKKLAIATKALKEIHDCTDWADDAFIYATEALKEIEEVK